MAERKYYGTHKIKLMVGFVVVGHIQTSIRTSHRDTYIFLKIFLMFLKYFCMQIDCLLTVSPNVHANSYIFGSYNFNLSKPAVKSQGSRILIFGNHN